MKIKFKGISLMLALVLAMMASVEATAAETRECTFTPEQMALEPSQRLAIAAKNWVQYQDSMRSFALAAEQDRQAYPRMSREERAVYAMSQSLSTQFVAMLESQYTTGRCLEAGKNGGIVWPKYFGYFEIETSQSGPPWVMTARTVDRVSEATIYMNNLVYLRVSNGAADTMYSEKEKKFVPASVEARKRVEPLLGRIKSVWGF